MNPTGADLERRVYLRADYSDKEAVMKHGATWCPIQGRWWIDRKNIATHPGIWRWIDPASPLRAEAKDAEAFMKSNRAKLPPVWGEGRPRKPRRGHSSVRSRGRRTH